MSASSTASAARRGSAPGASTCAINSISSGSPEAAFRERHLGTATVGGAVVAPDEAASLHPSEVMGQPASLPLDDCRQFRRSQPRAIGFSQRQQHLIVGRRDTRLLELRTQNTPKL